MSLVLPKLYHWSPVERRKSIRKRGLRTYQKPTVAAGKVRSPYICLGFGASDAWSLSMAIMLADKEDDPESWDLWQVVLPDHAEIHVLPEFGYRLKEVRCFSSLPVSAIWYVGTRDAHPSFE